MSINIKVLGSCQLSFKTWGYLEKDELAVSVTGRLVHERSSVALDSEDLAISFCKALEGHRKKDADKEFEAVTATCKISDRAQQN